MLKNILVHLYVLGVIKAVYILLKTVIHRRSFEFQIKIPDSKRCAILRSGTTDLEVFKKVFIDTEYALPFVLDPHSIIDLGANTGLTCLYFHLQYPKAKIIAVEPDPDNFLILQKQVRCVENVICLHAAAWSKCGEIHLIDPGLGEWGMRVSEQVETATYKNTVKAIAITSLLKMLPNEHCDLLKVDIEGAEKEVFTDGSDWIHRINSMVMELHDRYKPGCSRAVFGLVNDFQGEKWVGENVFFWR